MVPRLSLPATTQMLIYGLYQKRFPLSFDRGNIQFPLGDELVNQRAVSYGTYNDGLGRGRIALGQLRCGARNVAISFARSPAARITPSQSSGETQRVVAFPAAAMQKASDDFSYRTYWGSVLSRSVFTGLSLLPVHPAVKKMLRIKRSCFIEKVYKVTVGHTDFYGGIHYRGCRVSWCL